MSPAILAVAVWLVLAVAVLGPGTPQAQAHETTFDDVPGSGEVHRAIEYLAAAGIVNGYSDDTFRPANLVTRGQAAKMIVCQQDIEVSESATETEFSDVDALYAPYVEAATAEGWVGGYSDGTFRTYNPLQRQNMAVIMVRSLGWEDAAQNLESEEIEGVLEGFSDAAKIAAHARPYVAVAVSEGLFKGDGQGHFNPTAGITRGQFGLVVYRAEMRGVTVVEGIRAGTDHEGKTRIVFDLSAAPGGEVEAQMAGSSVLVVELPGAALADGRLDLGVGSEEVQAVAARQPEYRPPAVRLTLTLQRFQRYEVFTVGPSGEHGHRLVIDAFARTDGPEGPGGPLVALDAGHGGDDSGAVGITGTLEKDVNLAITKIADQALRDAGVRTLLTRTDDSFVSLSERSSLANQAKASLFVSIHNNASPNSDANGTETFYWGTSEEEYSEEGKKLAEAIQTNLVVALDSSDRTARTHWYNLHVLSATDMPAALAEVGFLTNEEEEAKLKDPEYCRTAGEAIARGVLQYLGWVEPLPAESETEDATTTTTTTTAGDGT